MHTEETKAPGAPAAIPVSRPAVKAAPAPVAAAPLPVEAAPAPVAAAKKSTKDSIFGSEDTKSELISVPEWGITIRLRGLSGIDRDAYDQSLYETKVVGDKTETVPNLANQRARMLVKCILDAEEGNRVFTDDEAARLGTKNAGVLDRLYTRARFLSGLDKAAKDAIEGN